MASVDAREGRPWIDSTSYAFRDDLSRFILRYFVSGRGDTLNAVEEVFSDIRADGNLEVLRMVGGTEIRDAF